MTDQCECDIDYLDPACTDKLHIEPPDLGDIRRLQQDLENAEASERKMTELNIANRARLDTLRKEISNYANEVAFGLPDVARDLRHILAANERASR
ncbi:hypothetical protein GCM10028801_31530 [Nocardioides maradonensis]